MILAATVTSCSASKNLDAVESEVTRFHQELTAGKFDQIYTAAADDLKKVTGQQEFVKLLRAVNSKLGPTRVVKRTGWNVNVTTSGSFVALTFDTQFEKGRGTEQFVYRITGGKALLAGYHIMSNDLIVN